MSSAETWDCKVQTSSDWIIMRNAGISVSHNAIVDVRHRRHGNIFNISKTIRAGNFKIYYDVAIDSLYISTCRRQRITTKVVIFLLLSR